MPTLTLYQLDADPFVNIDVTVTNSYTVDIIDNDGSIESTDSDGSPQLDVSGVPNLSGSTSFEVFESYTGTVGGAAVTFTLIQFSGSIYMFVTSGSVEVGQTIEGTNNGAPDAPDRPYNDLPDFVCFSSEAPIETSTGPRRADALSVGDHVVTADGQLRKIKWIGRCHLSHGDLQKKPHLRPVVIKRNAFETGVPSQDVRVSPQHRIALTSFAAELYFGTRDVLVPARFLVNGQDVHIDEDVSNVVYIHILFDKHELVNVSGLWSESLFLGETTVGALPEETQSEIFELFPDFEGCCTAFGSTALPVLKPFEARAIRESLSAFQTGQTAQQLQAAE